MEKLKKLLSNMYVPIGAAVVIMVVACVVQGRWSERWGTFPELALFAEQLSVVPMEVGEWRGTDEEKSEERIAKIAGNEGELNRTYRNAAGQEVRVSLVCARLQDIFFHSPDRCYPAAGFEMQGDPHLEEFEAGNQTAQFLTTTFLKSDPTGTHALRGYWSWSGDGTWLAPSNPKLKFAGQRALYKLYVFSSVPQGSKKQAAQGDFSADFIRAFVPALEVALKPAMEKAGRVSTPEPTAEQPAAAEPAT